MSRVSIRQLRPAQSGLVLVIVLWIVALLAVMAGAFAYSMQTETRLAASAVERAQARAVAEAGVIYALVWQQDLESRQQWSPNGDERDWSFAGATLRIRMADASGLINLNTADPELLKALLAAADLDRRDQDRLAMAILEQRNPTALPRPGARSHPGGQPARFMSIEEVQQTPGMAPAIYARIAGLVTVFSDHQGVNPVLAPIPVLRALGMDERAAADYVETRARVTTGNLPPPVPTSRSPFLFPQDRANVYHVTVAAETATGTTATVTAVLDARRTTSGDSLPRLLVWRDGH